MTVNFIRMEFFRLTKMKALIVLPIILVVIMFVQTFFLLRFNPEGALVSALGLESVATQLGGSSENYSMFGKGEGYNYTVAQTFESNVHGTLIILMIAIMAALFLGSDYATHNMKNYPIINGRRWVKIVSQMAVLAVFVLAVFILTWIVSFISNMIWARSLRLGLSLKSLRFFVRSYLAAMAFVSTLCLLVTLTKSRAGGMVFGILIAIGILNIPINIFDFLLEHKYHWKDFSLNYLFPARILEKVGMDASGKVVILTTFCAIIYLILTFAGSILLSSKRDLDT